MITRRLSCQKDGNQILTNSAPPGFQPSCPQQARQKRRPAASGPLLASCLQRGLPGDPEQVNWPSRTAVAVAILAGTEAGRRSGACLSKPIRMQATVLHSTTANTCCFSSACLPLLSDAASTSLMRKNDHWSAEMLCHLGIPAPCIRC